MSSARQLDASIIIPTYNRRRILEKVLQALLNQTYPPERFELIVVDDGSTDDTRDLVMSLKAPFNLHYLYQPNRGRSAARNLGIRWARAPLLIFLDSDIVVEPGFVAAHIEAHRRLSEGGQRWVVNGPVIYTEDFERPTETVPRWTDMSRAFFATGNASVHRADILEAGMFDEQFVEYGWEDLELGDRLRDLGLRSTTEPKARGFHLQEPANVASLPARMEKERQRGRTALIYFRKRPTFRVRAKLQLLWPFFVLDRVLMAVVAALVVPQGLQQRLMSWERDGRTGLVRFVTKVVLQHAYMEGLREGLRAGTVKPAR